MKNVFTLLILFFHIVIASGQSPSTEIFYGGREDKKFNFIPAKVSSTQYRLVKVNIDSISGAPFTPLSEITYAYSGDRGGNYLYNLVPFANGTIDFDTSVVKLYTGSIYIPTHRILRNYNIDNLVSDETTELYDLTTFDPYQFETFAYGVIDLDEKVKLEWNGSAYDSLFRNIYTYTDTLLTEKFVERHMSGIWSNRDLFVYSYNANGAPDTIQIQKWIGGSWYGQENYFFSYNAEGFIEYLVYQQNVGSGFVDYAQIAFTFNADSQLIAQEQQLFTGVEWANFIKEEYVYDTDGNLSYFDVYVWDGTAYLPKYRYSFTYETYGEIIAIEDVVQNNLEIYPNPAESYLFVSAKNNMPIKNIQFYNTNGQLVSSILSEAASTVYINHAKGLPATSGIYYVVCTTIDDKRYMQSITLY